MARPVLGKINSSTSIGASPVYRLAGYYHTRWKNLMIDTQQTDKTKKWPPCRLYCCRLVSAIVLIIISSISKGQPPYPPTLSASVKSLILEMSIMANRGDSTAFTTYYSANKALGLSPINQLWVDYALADAYLEQVMFTKALKVLRQVVQGAIKLKAPELEALALIHIALVHEYLMRPNDCLRYLNEAAVLIDRHGLVVADSWHAVRVSSYEKIFGNKEVAMKEAVKAAKLGKEHGVLRAHADGLLMIGLLSDDTAVKIKQYTEAANLNIDAQLYSSGIGHLCNVADVYLREKAYTKVLGIVATIDSLWAYVPYPDNKNADRKYQYASDALYGLGMIDSAYRELDRSKQYLKKVQFTFNQDAINQSEVVYAIERKEREIRQAEIKSKLLLSGMVLATIVVSLILVLLYRMRKTNKEIIKQRSLTEQANIELQAANVRQQYLLTDVHHRVKNNLQLINSLLSLKASKGRDRTTEEDLVDVSQKIKSISLMHEQLYRNQTFDVVDMHNYLKELTEHFAASYPRSDLLDFELNIAPIQLNMETVIPLGLLITELISNSLKYAAVDGQAVVIALQLSPCDKDRYLLYYTDNGEGYPDGRLPTDGQGMGATIIHGMSRQLKGEAKSYNDHGAVYKMTFTKKEISII